MALLDAVPQKLEQAPAQNVTATPVAEAKVGNILEQITGSPQSLGLTAVPKVCVWKG